MLTTWSAKVSGLASARRGGGPAERDVNSRLLLAEEGQRQGQEDQRDERKRRNIAPEVGDAERLGEYADRNLLVPRGGEAEADDPRPARERRDRREHAGEIDGRHDRENRRREDGRDLCPGEG